MPTAIVAPRARWFRRWPWLVLALAAVPAVWHAVDFPEDIDPEFPEVARPTLSRRPPPAYRLAEPGDTIDRVAIYTSAGAVVLSLAGAWLGRGRRGLWVSALGLSAAAFWYASTPGPTFDGWHGWGWRAIFDPDAPAALRVALALAATGLSGLVLIPLVRSRARWREPWDEARGRGVAALLVAASVLALFRQVEIPGVEPVGYWPRWGLVLGLIAFDLALFRLLVSLGTRGWPRRLAFGIGGGLAWIGLVVAGIWLTWYHRPLERLRTVVPGKIYMSAMPTGRGLEVAQGRHHFKTIINLFPEDTPLRSRRLPEELRFVKAHGIRYVGSPSDSSELGSSEFLDTTLALAQDPAAWPILVHCHGCMDRTPAWMGIYRFLVQGKSLAEILQEIERHRGYRPKASVILLYNRVLSARAPERYATDPLATVLKRCAEGTRDPAVEAWRASPSSTNPGGVPRVSRGRTPRPGVPNLTPPRRSLEYQKTLRDPQLHEPTTSS